MAHSKTDKQIISEITKYREICLIHRYLYYVKSESIISDLAYDTFERKLKQLVTDNPTLEYEADNFSYCPTKNVGSDNPEDYPRRVEQLAESLLTHKGDYEKGLIATGS
jgi:NAD-dependent DNA ligase